MKYVGYDEIYGILKVRPGSDTIPFHRDDRTALIIQLTIGFLSNNPGRSEKVHVKKKKIYQKLIHFYEEYFRA